MNGGLWRSWPVTKVELSVITGILRKCRLCGARSIKYAVISRVVEVFLLRLNKFIKGTISERTHCVLQLMLILRLSGWAWVIVKLSDHRVICLAIVVPIRHSSIVYLINLRCSIIVRIKTSWLIWWEHWLFFEWVQGCSILSGRSWTAMSTTSQRWVIIALVVIQFYWRFASWAAWLLPSRLSVNFVLISCEGSFILIKLIALLGAIICHYSTILKNCPWIMTTFSSTYLNRLSKWRFIIWWSVHSIEVYDFVVDNIRRPTF